MKKLLQINTVINSGSTGRIAEDIGALAIDNGWDSYISYGRDDRPSRSNKIKIGTEWDVKWHGLQTRVFDNHGLASKQATKKFIEKIEVLNPDIVHLHNLHGYYLNIKLLFNYLAKENIPTVWTLHDCWSFTGHCTHFSFVDCMKWKTQCYDCPQKAEYPASFFLDCSNSNFTLKKEIFNSVKNMMLVPVSDWLSDMIGESFLQSYPRQRIYNGVDINTFSPQGSVLDEIAKQKYNVANKFILLGVAGVWSNRKGLADFVELSNILKDDEMIILVGLSDTQLDKLPSKIIGIKKTEDIKELVSIYSMSDIILNLSVEETFGMTTVEGYSCGRPSIAYNCTASPELVTEETGCVVERGNFIALRKCIDLIKGNYEKYPLACRNRAKLFFNKVEKYKDYLQIYDHLKERK